jgi:hypothetical protein
VRSVGARIDDVRRWLAAARAVVRDRAHIVPDLVRSTGLSRAGVELGLERCLEVEATDDELRALVAEAGDVRCVHVVLSANVFVAPLRAIALARAASERVVVRPSRREPVLARALAERAGDTGVTLTDTIDIEAIEEGEVHVYGRDETIASVRASAHPGVLVRGHGAGMGVAIVSMSMRMSMSQRARLDVAAGALADDVVLFDQRGCLSPRVAVVEGDEARAQSFALELDAALTARERDIPRGALGTDERAELRRWADANAYAGTLHHAADHAVAFVPPRAPLLVPPPGRHVQVACASDLDEARGLLAPIRRFIVCVGANDVARAAAIAPAHARLATLGSMQRPPLDGPVDKR